MELTLKLRRRTRDAFNKLLLVVNQVGNSYFFCHNFSVSSSWNFYYIIISERMNDIFCVFFVIVTDSFINSLCFFIQNQGKTTI